MTKKMMAALAIMAIAAAGCGTNANGPAANAGTTTAGCAKGSVMGAGSTFVATLAQQWIKDFGARCPGATVTYQAVGSGAGITQLTEGTVQFAGSDAMLKPDEAAALAAKGDVLTIPWAAGGVGVLVNLRGVDTLRLSPATLAGIYAGTIKRWDAAAVVADNPGVPLPGTAVHVVHRSDGSGTTKVFTSYLTATAPAVWKAGADKEIDWPAGLGAKGSDGVAIAVKQTDGAIGYAEVAYAASAGLHTALLRNASGAFVAPTAAAVSAALAEADPFTATAAAAYPLSTLTYVIAPAGSSAVLKAFVKYALTDGRKAAEPLSYAPLPDSVATKALADADRLS
jgi:phosphate transport system substrate-binding protein